MVQLKIVGSHLTCKVSNKCLNVREGVEMVERTMVPFLPLQPYESSVSVKENPNRKKRILKSALFRTTLKVELYWEGLEIDEK